MKKQSKKWEKIEEFAENGKSEEDCSQSRVSPDKKSLEMHYCRSECSQAVWKEISSSLYTFMAYRRED